MQTLHNTSKKWHNLALGILGGAMVAVSAYLTRHYFDMLFPQNFSVGSFCDISRFWNCDNAAFSSLSNIFNVPTSLFGVAFGLMILFGAVMQKASLTQTNYFLALVNLVGCLFLLGYSLIFLHGLCPGCTVYYVLSLAVVLVFLSMKAGPPFPKFFVLVCYGLFTLIMMGATYGYNHERFAKQDAMIDNWIGEMRKKPAHDESVLGFELPLVKSTENFTEAPLRVTLFSDFQCQFCKLLSAHLEKLAPRYQGKINIQYLFFPLDSACNDKVSSRKHPLACAAARLSYCARSNFTQIHDDIYAHQDNLSETWLLQKATELNVKECYESEETTTRIKELVDKGDFLNIDGAPFTLVNGYEISGLIPVRALMALLDSLLNDNVEK